MGDADQIKRLENRTVPRPASSLNGRLPSERRTEEQSSVYPLTPVDIRYGDKIALVRRIVQALDAGIKPTEDVAKALLSRLAAESLWPWNDPIEKKARIPYPEGSEGPSTLKKEELVQRIYIIEPGKSKIVDDYNKSHGYSPTAGLMDEDGLRWVTFLTLEQTDESIRPAIMGHVLELLPFIPEDREEFLASVFALIRDSKHPNKILEPFMDYLYKHRDQIYPEHFPAKSTKREEYIAQDIAYEAGNIGFNNEMILSYLASLPLSEDQKMKFLLGVFVHEATFPQAINTVRRMLLSEKTPEEMRIRLERVGRVLLGEDPDDASKPFHTTLNSVYQALEKTDLVSFKNYPPNISATGAELDMLEKMLQVGSNDSLRGPILDLACGTGRIANGLAKRGIRNIIGLDHSPSLLDIAKKEDTTGLVSYIQGDWESVRLGDKSLARVICIGRSLPHVEDEEHFYQVMNEVNRLLMDGGEFIFDFPNPNKGQYLENRRAYIRFLRSVGWPIEKMGGENELLRRFPYVVDGPNDRDHYNRFVPPEKYILERIHALGFDIEVIQRVPIVGGVGNENIYFKAVKRQQRDIRQSPNFPAWWQEWEKKREEAA